MSQGTRLFLLLGCAIVVALEAPSSLASLIAGWRGPYSRPAVAAAEPAVPLGPERALLLGRFAPFVPPDVLAGELAELAQLARR